MTGRTGDTFDLSRASLSYLMTSELGYFRDYSCRRSP